MARAHSHPCAPAENTVPKTSPATLRSSAFPAGPPGGQIQALAFGFRQLAALSPPSRALTVHEIWVPRRLLLPGDLGFPMQWWRPRLPFLERLIPTSGQFPRRYMRRWGDKPRRPPSDRAGGAGAEVGPFPPSGRAGEAQVRMVARLGMAALWHPELLPPCLQLPRQTSRTSRHYVGITELLLLCRWPFGYSWVLASPGPRDCWWDTGQPPSTIQGCVHL